MIAICRIREQPHYRRDAFVNGLRRAGYSLVESGRPSGPQDLLVIWNRYGANEVAADAWEGLGGTVIVCENGYAGVDDQGRQHYAMAAHGHNGSGWFPVGDEDRLAKLGIELHPWRVGGDHILVCAQRGIGSREMASPQNWHAMAVQRLRKVTDRPIKVRLHPGNQAPAVPLTDDLRDAWACVIWSSGCGVQALITGVPVYYDAPHWICEDGVRRVNDFGAVVVDGGWRRRALQKMAWGQRSVAEIESGEPFVTFREAARMAA